MQKALSITPNKIKKLQKIFTWFAIISLLLQLSSGLFLYRPVFAEEEIHPEPLGLSSGRRLVEGEETPEEETEIPKEEDLDPIDEEVTLVEEIENPEGEEENVEEVIEEVAETEETEESAEESVELNPSVSTDKEDYAPGETVKITGENFPANTLLIVQVSRPDGSIVKGDGSFEEGSDEVTSDEEGKFEYHYQLDGIEGEYLVEVLDVNGAVLATTTFRDTIVGCDLCQLPFEGQCGDPCLQFGCGDCCPPCPILGKITVCKVIIDPEGNIVDGSERPGAEFSINWNGAGTMDPNPTVFDSPLVLNTDLFGDENFEAECITYDEIALGDYYYSEETTPATGWQEPLYNDQNASSVNSLDDFYPFNDPDHSTDADGHIILNQCRRERTLVVLNQYETELVELGSIQGRKYQDVNGNGVFDQEEKDEVGNPNRLDDWWIYLYDDNWDLEDEMLTGDDTTPAGNVGKGQYRFVNLPQDTYYVCEEDRRSEGWQQTEPNLGTGIEHNGLYCHQVNLNAGQEKKGITFGNYYPEEICEPPSLVITKSNDKIDKIVSSGDTVNYTITVTNDGKGTAFDVSVEDQQPTQDYFDYLQSSGHLTCTDGTDTNLTAAGSNPYFWALGDLEIDEVCTLTYAMEIKPEARAGKHYNLARALGYDCEGQPFSSEIVEDPFDLEEGIDLSNRYQVEIEREGEVLAAAVLGAATGSSTFWLILSLLMIFTGLILRLLQDNKWPEMIKKVILNIILLNLIAVSYGARPVQAVDTQPPVVHIIELPEYKRVRDFEISYTALDAGEGLKDVHLEYKKEGGGWQDLGTYSQGAHKIKVDSSKINEDGKYYFKATACDQVNNCDFDETSTTVDTTNPPKPESYSKEKITTNSYKIKWHNPDSDDLYQVYIYRSDEKEFDANNDSRVAIIDVSKNTDREWIDSVVDPSKDYYYALRSADRAGNSSDLVGDEQVTYVSPEGEEVPAGEAVSEEAILGEEAVVEEDKGLILGEEEKEEGEEIVLEGDADEGEVEGAEVSRFPWKWLLAGLIIIGLGYQWFQLRKKS